MNTNRQPIETYTVNGKIIVHVQQVSKTNADPYRAIKNRSTMERVDCLAMPNIQNALKVIEESSEMTKSNQTGETHPHKSEQFRKRLMEVHKIRKQFTTSKQIQKKKKTENVSSKSTQVENARKTIH